MFALAFPFGMSSTFFEKARGTAAYRNKSQMNENVADVCTCFPDSKLSPGPGQLLQNECRYHINDEKLLNSHERTA
jgi:hypothetical protein